jgi:coatomer protein complex subunit alpha (xenin)
MHVAFEAAKEIKDKDNFNKLSLAALSLGNLEITEKCYQIGRQFDKLNFLYASTGSIGKLRRMQGVAASVNDHTLRFNTALMTGDVSERVKVLAETG